MTTKQEEEQQEQVESDCKHHWVIDSPNGPTSEGVCKICGERSEFRNSMPGSGWDRENPQSKRARQTRGKQAPESTPPAPPPAQT